jgi:rod shape-determining protein MreD
LRYALLFVIALLFEVAALQTLFRPGFIAPDVVLILLLSRAYLHGRSTILWAIWGGALLDLITDTIGLHLALETLSVYLFLLLHERFLFRTLLTYLIPAGVVLILKKLLALAMMKSKFSFSFSFEILLLSWVVEIVLLLAVYFLYLRSKE